MEGGDGDEPSVMDGAHFTLQTSQGSAPPQPAYRLMPILVPPHYTLSSTFHFLGYGF